MNRLRSGIAGIRWPALPPVQGVPMLSMQYQLAQSEWWTPDRIVAKQMGQLSTLLDHAYAAIPFYRERLDAAGYRPGVPLTSAEFSRIPVLSRQEVQELGPALSSMQYPREHGRVTEIRTSGSTGRPVTVHKTELSQFFWRAFTLRDHLWHRRDFTGKLALIRTDVEDGQAPGWGPPTDTIFVTGPGAMLNIRHDLEAQANWLVREDPEYLLSHPSNVRALAEFFRAGGIQLPRLQEVRTFGEVVNAELRGLCHEVWGVRLNDMYSASETGYIALQCPKHEHYHVQAEGIYVEILDADDKPCSPGQVGRVVVTPLHNFATPLIRYEILDHAEVGEPCPCGRGLPVIKRVLGRERNLVTLPDGRRHWPSFPADRWAHIAPIRQIQLVQKTLENIEAWLVVDSPLTSRQEQDFIAQLQSTLGYPFTIALHYVDHIERKANFKYEDFISELPG